MNLQERQFEFAFKHRQDKNVVDIHMLLMCYLGLVRADQVSEELMEMRKEFEICGYKFAIGIHNGANYMVGLLSWPGLRDFGPDELRRYRYAMFQAQAEISKMQNEIDRVLRQSAE